MQMGAMYSIALADGIHQHQHQQQQQHHQYHEKKQNLVKGVRLRCNNFS